MDHDIGVAIGKGRKGKQTSAGGGRGAGLDLLSAAQAKSYYGPRNGGHAIGRCSNASGRGRGAIKTESAKVTTTRDAAYETLVSLLYKH